MKFTQITAFIKRIVRTKRFMVLMAIGLLVLGYMFFFKKPPVYHFVTVERGPIVESISLTGNTTPTQSVELAFASSGVISQTYQGLGKGVRAGQILAQINMSDLFAQLRQAQALVDAQQARLDALKGGSRIEDIASAQANVDAQQARLDALKTGARSEDIATSQATLNASEQNLANIYASIADYSVDSYTKANDAVRTQLDAFFINDETLNPKLTYATGVGESDTEFARVSASSILRTWQAELEQSRPSQSEQERFVQSQITYLNSIRTLLQGVSTTLDHAPSLNEITRTSHKTTLSIGLNEVNTATKQLNTLLQSIASQKLVVAQNQAQLTLKRAGATREEIAIQEAVLAQTQAQLDLKRAGTLPADLDAQQAQIDQAKAGVASVLARIQNGKIIAPINGTITRFDVKIGQLASQGTPLISIMSDAGYEVHADVSETDIGKLVLGNKVVMSLDAFPGETFDGSVFYIAPSETNTQGVVSFELKISFDQPDARLKSGLTTTCDLETKRKEDILKLPQYAILQNDEGTFVQTLEQEKVVNHAVVLGIQDKEGFVEIVKGVQEGQQVLNIGRKAL